MNIVKGLQAVGQVGIFAVWYLGAILCAQTGDLRWLLLYIFGSLAVMAFMLGAFT